MWTTVLLIVYCVLIVASSLGGGVLPSLVKITHTRMQAMMSFVGGLMLGVALLHMLPHAVAHDPGAVDEIAVATVAGLLAMFFLIRIFHVHQHEQDETACAHVHHPHEHDHDHEHNHDQGGGQGHGRHRLSWIGIMTGLSIHTLIDGVALAASVSAESHAHSASLFGVGTFFAVFLHKPLDALSITWLMSAGGWSPRKTMLVNFCFALMCPLGALAFYFGLAEHLEHNTILLSIALAFSAGAFLCISLADLLPEVQFHSHDRLKLSVWLVLGVLAAYGIGFLEPDHTHQHTAPGHQAHEEQGHDHGESAH